MLTVIQATLDKVPIWIWLIVTFMGAGALYYFFAPIINIVLAVTPKPVKIVLAAIATLIGAFIYGRYRGAKTAKELEAQRSRQAVETRSKVNESIKSASDADLDKRADRWMRD